MWETKCKQIYGLIESKLLRRVNECNEEESDIISFISLLVQCAGYI